MNNIYRCFALAVALAVSVQAFAQDLDPTVVVDRAYEGKLMEVHKPVLEMAVPDTVMRFDLDFDYAVFERPYKGSYEFNPYLLSMKPSAATDKAGRFYLRAGAGYQLRPEVDVIWSPVLKNKALRLDVFGYHRSYIGNYYLTVGGESEKSKGSFLKSKAGINAGYDWKKSSLSASVSYNGVHGFGDGEKLRGFNAVDADFSVGTRADVHSGFVYSADVSFRHAADRGMKEDFICAGLSFEADMRKAGRFRLDVEAEHDGCNGLASGSASVASVVPHYVYKIGRFHADLGLRLSKVVAEKGSGLYDFSAKEQYLYPDVDVRLSLVPDWLMIFAKAGGGNCIVSYSDIVEKSYFLAGGMGVEVERISAEAGMEGRIGNKFSWNMHAGYADYASAAMEMGGNAYAVGYAPCQSWHGTVEWLWRSDRFMADGAVTYRNSWGDAFRSEKGFFKPASIEGDVSFEYNFNRRIFAGLSCSFSSARKASAGLQDLPGYADLGLSAEYVTSRSLSFWIKGGNLLGMSIQKHPLYAVKGPYATVGISLKL